jgi:WhiB family redox-sensing transcriptional regulator
VARELAPWQRDPAELFGGLDLAELLERPAWMERGACRDRPDITFFPERGQSGAPAKAVCAECPVRRDCLDYAVTHGERHGIWGGTSERERRRLRTPGAA